MASISAVFTFPTTRRRGIFLSSLKTCLSLKGLWFFSQLCTAWNELDEFARTKKQCGMTHNDSFLPSDFSHLVRRNDVRSIVFGIQLLNLWKDCAGDKGVPGVLVRLVMPFLEQGLEQRSLFFSKINPLFLLA